jgi:hypothetical protein
MLGRVCTPLIQKTRCQFLRLSKRNFTVACSSIVDRLDRLLPPTLKTIPKSSNQTLVKSPQCQINVNPIFHSPPNFCSLTRSSTAPMTPTMTNNITGLPQQRLYSWDQSQTPPVALAMTGTGESLRFVIGKWTNSNTHSHCTLVHFRQCPALCSHKENVSAQLGQAKTDSRLLEAATNKGWSQDIGTTTS